MRRSWLGRWMTVGALFALNACQPESRRSDPPSASPKALSEALLVRPKPQKGVPDRLTPAFSRLRFQKPAAIAYPEDGSGRVFVAERGGRVLTFPHRPDAGPARVFLDLRGTLGRISAEDGLRGLAFHPRFRETRSVFVFYIAPHPTRAVVSRFKALEALPDLADPDSEEVLFEVELPFSTHRGGGLAFGRDGYLYVGLGDGGGLRDPLGHGQNRETLLGSVLRLDVDAVSSQLNYSVPPGNPFLGNRDGYLPEIYAYGFCNPHQLSIDSQGRLWALDSTGGLGEEINRIAAGGNYGWGRVAGTRCLVTPCPSPAPVAPVHVYGPKEGIAIAGISIYRGARWPDLKDAILYADGLSGKVSALRPEASGAQRHRRLFDAPLTLVGLGEDPSHEPLFLADDGHLYQLAGP